MKYHQAKFIKSVHELKDLPDNDLPQIAFAGRSNVGKSSLINTILHQKKLAKISSTPGKTRSLNFFLIDERFYLVDLPGYGFAKVSREAKRRWQALIEGFLSASENLRGAIVIVDSRIGLTELDEMMISWLKHVPIPFRVIATKIDKLSRNEQARQFKKINANLEKLAVLPAIPFSAKTGEGEPALWKVLYDFLGRKQK
ncbi:MAG: YihA family ribosome biogenesis GTP-binding protein [Calditrichaeota bacterium]|nr:YihA family ribosome biogenesis GTP-binding protein [Calditrichota bacterium]